MQRFPCPFCGIRKEHEFRFAGEAGKTRPDTTSNISDATWSKYLYMQDNSLGASEEIWVHLPCQEYFIMTRDTQSMQVLETRQIRKDAK